MNAKQLAEICRVDERTIFTICRQPRNQFKAKKWHGDWRIFSCPFDCQPMLTIEIAALIGCSQRLIELFCRQKRIRAVKIGRQHRIPFTEGMRFVETRMKQAGQWFGQKGNK